MIVRRSVVQYIFSYRLILRASYSGYPTPSWVGAQIKMALIQIQTASPTVSSASDRAFCEERKNDQERGILQAGLLAYSFRSNCIYKRF